VRVRISAAALGARRGTAVCVAIALGTAVPAAISAATSATPLVQVKPRELRLSQPLAALAADGKRAAFAFCEQLVGVWRPGDAGVTRLGPVAQWTCPPPRGPEHTFSLAFAGDRVAWIVSAGGNQYTNLTFLVVLGNPHTFTIAVQTAYCCRGEDPDPNRLGDIYGDDGFIVFRSRFKCGDNFPPPSCAGQPQTTLVSETAWRLRRPPFQAQCVNQQGPCQQLATANSVLQPLSVSAGRVVLRRANGALEIRKPNGAVTRQFPGLAGLTRGADLMGRRLLVLVPAHLRVYNVVTGALVRSRPLPNVTSGGVCGLAPCPTVALQMLDAARGLVVYTLAGKLHLLRLRDGRDRVVAPAVDARFGDNGLFYAYTAPAPWIARIRFVPWAALSVRP
jgi:hypothetical protein